MRANEHGLPEPGETSSYLGVREDYDIPMDENGMVRPMEPPAGLSVTPDNWRRMSNGRIPKALGGTGKHAMFALNTEDLGPLLGFRRDPDNPVGHGFIEPAHPMSFEEYQAAIHATAALWERVT